MPPLPLPRLHGDQERIRPAPAEPERPSAASRQEALLDQAIEETFPASDPISPMLVS